MNPAGLQRIEATPGAARNLRQLERDDFDRDVWSILGVPVDVATAPDAVVAIESAARDRMRLSFVTPNVNFLVRSRRNAEARRHMIDTDLSLIDGAPLVALARMLGAPIKERCAGSDVFEALRRRTGFPGRRLKVFFFGGRDGAAEAAAAAINAEGRGLEAAGFYNPGAGDVASMSTPEIIERINAAAPDFVLVALGAEKGQEWIDANRRRLGAPVVAHLGAVVDFTAGSIGRAPAWMRRIGLEWAWRIKEEPALWRRYANDAFSLAGIIARAVPIFIAPSAPTGTPATAELSVGSTGAVLRLTGDLIAPDLGAVRQAFRAAAEAGRDVVLDFAAAGVLDAAFLGQVLMLEKRLRESGASIMVANLGRRHRRVLAAHAMPYAAAELASLTADAAPDRGIAAAV